MTISTFSNFTLAGSYASGLQAAKNNDQQHTANHPETKIRVIESRNRTSLLVEIAKLLRRRSNASSTSEIRVS